MRPDATLTNDQIATYRQDGYLIVKNVYDKKEIDHLYSVAVADKVMEKNALDLNDQGGRKTRLSQWFTPGNDPFGYLARGESRIAALGQLMESTAPVCHYHSKLMQKEPKVGGAWEWHQDYGYWYKNQFMFPDQLISVMVALTPATRENGCLQVLKGSHKVGRVNHAFSGEQLGADRTMVDNALKTMELVYCELAPGDVLYFHPNLLHRSAPNLSESPRWSFISCYNLQSNIAYNETSVSWKEPVRVVPDEAILEWEAQSLADADFLKRETDIAVKNSGWKEKP
jgi:ectoine hydroxylase-related dioxygenase (phytanoyl-CoA dioxygenase family)